MDHNFLCNNIDALHIEGYLRFSDNINKAVKLYGDDILVRIVQKKYFEEIDKLNNKEYPTLVLIDDNDIILGKPRYPKYFPCAIYRIKITKTSPFYNIQVAYPVLKHYIDTNKHELFKLSKSVPLSKKNKKRKCVTCKIVSDVTRVISWASVDYFCQSCLDDQLKCTDEFLYEYKCITIKKIIEKKYNDTNFIYEMNNDTRFVEIIINNQSKITILRDNTVSEILKHIKTKLDSTWQKQNCDICFEKINKRVSCSKCSNYYCSNCYINIFKTGKGIITCPFCRYSYGTKMNDFMLPMAIKEIKYKLGE